MTATPSPGAAPPDPSHPWERVDGRVPVVIHVPHAGTWIPDDERDAFVLGDDALADELRRMTDHATDVLAQAAVEAGAYAFVNRLSRLVCDPERFPDEREELEAVGMGFAYTRTADGKPLRDLGEADRARVKERWFDPYAEAFGDLVREVREEHGRCLVLDLHSYPAERLAYERGRIARPDVCLGKDEGHTPGWAMTSAIEACERLGLWWDINTPFAGAYVPEWAYGKDRSVSALMLEVRRDVYLDEETLELTDGAPLVAELVRQVAVGLEMDVVELADGWIGFGGGGDPDAVAGDGGDEDD